MVDGEKEFRKKLEDIVRPEGKEKYHNAARVIGPILAGVAGGTIGIMLEAYNPALVQANLDFLMPALLGFKAYQVFEKQYSKSFCQDMGYTNFSTESLPRGLFSDLETKLERDPSLDRQTDSIDISSMIRKRKVMPRRWLAGYIGHLTPTLELAGLKGAARWLKDFTARHYTLKNEENVSSSTYLDASYIALDGGDLYRSLMYFNASLWVHKEEIEKDKDQAIVLGTGVQLSILRRSIRLGDKPELEAIKYANTCFFSGHEEKAEEIWDLLNENYKDDMGIQMYDALRLGFLNNGLQVRKKWKHILSLVDRRGFTYETVGEYRNEVLRCAVDSPDAEALANLLFFKKSKNPDNLQREFRNLEYFNEFFKGRVTQPIALIEQDDGIASVMFSAGKKNLFQRIIEEGCDVEEKKRLLYGAADFLAQIHVVGTQAKEELDLGDTINEGYFIERINSVFIDQSREHGTSYDVNEISRLLQNYYVIDDHLIVLERDFYKDANPMNWIDSRLGIQAIDFEGDKLLPCQLDLVSLFEFGENYISRVELDKALEKYVKQKEKLTRKSIDMDEFKLSYHYAAVQRHIELAGYRTRDISTGQNEEWCRKATPYHLKAAVCHVDKILLYEKIKGIEKDKVKSLDIILDALGKLSQSYGHERPVHVEDTT